MKNPGTKIYIILTLLFVGIVLGILVSKFSNKLTIIISRNWDGVTPTTAISDNKTYGKININTATADQLSMLPGIGVTTAENIITYRNENGVFISLNDLLKVKGIGEKRLEQIKDYITVVGG